MISKDSENITLKTDNGIETYKIIKVIEFSSERKMMSVIVQDVNSGNTYLFSKGADIAIIPKLQDK